MTTQTIEDLLAHYAPWDRKSVTARAIREAVALGLSQGRAESATRVAGLEAQCAAYREALRSLTEDGWEIRDPQIARAALDPKP